MEESWNSMIVEEILHDKSIIKKLRREVKNLAFYTIANRDVSSQIRQLRF